MNALSRSLISDGLNHLQEMPVSFHQEGNLSAEQSAETMHPLQRAKIIPKTAQPVSPLGADICTPDLILALKPSLDFIDADSYRCREKNNTAVKLPRIFTEE